MTERNDANIQADLPPMTSLRPAGQVMRLERMGAFHQSRLSFMRVLLQQTGEQELLLREAEGG